MSAPDFAPVEACPECGDDAHHATAPGPGEPVNEYDCAACGHQFTLDAPVQAPDFAAILAGAMRSGSGSGQTVTIPGVAARSALTAKVPGLCWTCGGSGSTMLAGASARNSYPVECHDCPTIGQLLAIGAAVMTADDANPNQAPIHYRGTDHHVWASGWDAALDSLRAVQP